MKFLENLKALSPARQILLAAAVIGVVLAMTFLVRGTMKPQMTLLYSGLDPSSAGEVISELDQRGVKYEIRGEAIFIASSMRDSVRFSLARDGLPRQSVQGYELLDDVNGFSVTSEMYNAAYWRAKEGELTRTILAIPGVTAARVHIGASLRSGYSRSTSNQTASVTLTTSRALSKDQAEAVQYMVALAVAGLDPASVAVIDTERGIIAGPNSDGSAAPDLVAETQSGLIEAKVMRLLEPRVGAGNARVSVSLDVSRERQRVSSITFDPDSRIVRSRTTSDVSESSEGGSAGVSVSSNLPTGAAGTGGNTSTTRNSTESVAYEVNETRTEMEKLPGQIERISVAVVLNEQALGIDSSTPEGQEQLRQAKAEFEQLVLSGAGLDTRRGDALTVEIMPFQAIAAATDLTPAPSMMQRLIEQHLWTGIQAGLLGLVVIVLGLGVVRPMLAGTPKAAEATASAVAGASAAERDAIGSGSTPPRRDPFDELKDYTRSREEEAAALLQEWLAEDELVGDKKVAVNE